MENSPSAMFYLHSESLKKTDDIYLFLSRWITVDLFELFVRIDG